MKILIVVDKIPSAIWICGAKPKEILKDRCEIETIAVHPKRPNNLSEFEKKANEADLIDFEYFKTAEMLMEKFPFLASKPKILAHHNPYNVCDKDWFKKYDRVIVRNKTQQKDMIRAFSKTPILIPYTTDLGFFKFQREYPKENVFKIIMVAARIESNKGILEVARACRETKTRFILVGRISDMNYFREIVSEAGDYLDFRQDISDEELRNSYYEAHLFINNSTDNFESGSLPHLEAMACGVPVLTRRVGLVPDIENGKNMVVRDGNKEDIEDLVNKIKELKENRKLREKMREEAFKSIIDRDNSYYAIRYYRIYRDVLGMNKPLVSVIVPTYNRAKILQTTLLGIAAQRYPNIEIIVVDDGSNDETEKVVMEFKRLAKVPIKYVKQSKDGYGLARARNNGIVEAFGNILVFQDDRFMMDRDAINEFVDKLRPRLWLFGDKGANKKSFVENFSCIYKKDLVNMGMFNERMIYYGGMTRDLISKMRMAGVNYQYVPKAKCRVLLDSKSRFTKKDEIYKAKLLLWKLGGGE